jgi:hypothetical protein
LVHLVQPPSGSIFLLFSISGSGSGNTANRWRLIFGHELKFSERFKECTKSRSSKELHLFVAAEAATWFGSCYDTWHFARRENMIRVPYI